jgi:hypothetical protein
MDDDTPTAFVSVLFECSCNAHRLPTRVSSTAYNADDFNKDSVIVVSLKIKTWSFERAAVELYSNGNLFAACPLDGTKFSDSVERAVGSSRYFSLKVQR